MVLKKRLPCMFKSTSLAFALSLGACSEIYLEPIQLTKICEEKDPYRCNYQTSRPCVSQRIVNGILDSSAINDSPQLDSGWNWVEVLNFDYPFYPYLKGAATKVLVRNYDYDKRVTRESIYDVNIETNTSWIVPGHNKILKIDTVIDFGSISDRRTEYTLFGCDGPFNSLPSPLITQMKRSASTNYPIILPNGTKINLIDVEPIEKLYTSGKAVFEIENGIKFELTSGESIPIPGTSMVLILGPCYTSLNENGEKISHAILNIKIGDEKF